MANILTARVSIVGTRPILWHKFGPEALPLEKQERAGVPGHDPTEWRATCLYTNSGQLYVKSSYLFSAMREGAKHTKKGRGSILRLVAATLQVAPDRILLDRHIPGFDGALPDQLPTDPELPVYLDIRGVRNPNTRARNIRYRVAASPGWRCAFTLLWDCTVVSRNEMHAVAIDAGTLVGIGDGRSIGHGRYDVVEFDITE